MTEPTVHTVIRTISSTSDPMKSTVSGAEFDAYLSGFKEQGWKIKLLVYIGTSPDGISVLVILEK